MLVLISVSVFTELLGEVVLLTCRGEAVDPLFTEGCSCCLHAAALVLRIIRRLCHLLHVGAAVVKLGEEAIHGCRVVLLVEAPLRVCQFSVRAEEVALAFTSKWDLFWRRVGVRGTLRYGLNMIDNCSV